MDKRLLAGLSMMSAFSLRQLNPNLINQIVTDISLTQYLTLLINRVSITGLAQVCEVARQGSLLIEKV